MTLQPRLRALLAATAATALTPALFAQEDCATATIVGDGMFAYDTTTSVDEGIAISCGSGDANDIWFSYTATLDGDATFSLCGSGYDTRMAIYSDCVGTEITCNDDSCGLQSEINMPVVAGMTYLVRVAGWNGAVGAGTLTIDGPTVPDECVDAADVTPDLPIAFDTTVATPSPEAWTATGNTPKDVWFTFTPTADYAADISTCNTADYDTRLELYSGACGALVPEANNDDGAGCASFTSSIIGHPVLTGVQYFVRVGGFNAASEGTGTLLVTGPPPAVGNDNCNGAIALTNGGMELFDNTMATNSVGAPAYSCGNGAGDPIDLWYTVSPVQDSSITVDTFGSTLDTRLEIYSGDCGTLVSLGCNDDTGGLQSSLTVPGFAGETYFVRVAGYSGNVGTGQVNASFADMQSNDDCANAIAVGMGDTSFANLGATDSLVDMSCIFNGELSDVWFSYTAGGDCDVSIDFSGSSYDTSVVVYSGDCMTLTEVACDDDGGAGLTSFVSFPATAGTTYLIQVGGFNGASGVGVMNITEGNGTVICLGEANSTGAGAVLKVSGSIAVLDNMVSLDVTELPMNSMGYFLHSAETIFIANPGGSMGNLCIASFDLGRFAGDVLDSGAAGAVSFSPDLNNMPGPSGAFAVLAGDTRNFQLWYRDVDGGGMPTSNFSSATSVTFE